MKTPIFSILLPAYKAEGIIGETIDSILSQTFRDFELIICDDKSPDGTLKVLRDYAKKDSRVKVYENEKNLGYTGNLEECRKQASGEYIYLMGNDDILSPIALERTYEAFQMDPDVGAVTRQFYSFEDKNIDKPVRVFGWSLDPEKDRVYSISESREIFISIYATVGQLSGLAMRRDWVTEPVNPDVFPAHAYPFYSVIKKHKVVQLHDWLLAVRIFSSQTRSMSSIYNPSPTYTWVKMFKHIFPGQKYQNEREWGIDYICHDYIGLVQIKNYGTLKQLFTEFGVLIRYRKKNLYNPIFWFYILGVLITPRFILIPLADWYKSQVMSRRLTDIKLTLS
jgi:glycosyltransferase involved in cell wall biosynthesis